MTDYDNCSFKGVFNKILIISLNAPTVIGLRSILSQATDASVLSFNDVSDCFDQCRNADIIFISQSLLIQNIDFFLPRKSKLIVLTDSEVEESPSLLFLNVNCSESQFKNQCVELLNQVIPEKVIHSDLSAREVEVLKELSKGLTNKEIADNLCISVNTVITHRKNISSKLGIRSASGLSLYALMNGIL